MLVCTVLFCSSGIPALADRVVVPDRNRVESVAVYTCARSEAVRAVRNNCKAFAGDCTVGLEVHGRRLGLWEVRCRHVAPGCLAGLEGVATRAWWHTTKTHVTGSTRSAVASSHGLCSMVPDTIDARRLR